jgi:hypothetical protein
VLDELLDLFERKSSPPGKRQGGVGGMLNRLSGKDASHDADDRDRRPGDDDHDRRRRIDDRTGPRERGDRADDRRRWDDDEERYPRRRKRRALGDLFDVD